MRFTFQTRQQRPLFGSDKGLEAAPEFMSGGGKVVSRAGGIDQFKRPERIKERGHVGKKAAEPACGSHALIDEGKPHKGRRRVCPVGNRDGKRAGKR